MAELTVNMTYGSALFEVAKELNKAEEIYEELLQLLEIFEKEPAFFEFIYTPTISKEKKKEALKAVFDGKLIPQLLNFLYVLVDKSRAGNFSGIVVQYKSVMDDEHKIAEGEIYSAVELNPKQISGFEESVGQLLKEKVRLINKVDNSLIGGVKVFIEGKVIDASVKNRLHGMKESLSAAVI